MRSFGVPINFVIFLKFALYGPTAPSPVADCEFQSPNGTFEVRISEVVRPCVARFHAICNFSDCPPNRPNEQFLALGAIPAGTRDPAAVSVN